LKAARAAGRRLRPAACMRCRARPTRSTRHPPRRLARDLAGPIRTLPAPGLIRPHRPRPPAVPCGPCGAELDGLCRSPKRKRRAVPRRRGRGRAPARCMALRSHGTFSTWRQLVAARRRPAHALRRGRAAPRAADGGAGQAQRRRPTLREPPAAEGRCDRASHRLAIVAAAHPPRTALSWGHGSRSNRGARANALCGTQPVAITVRRAPRAHGDYPHFRWGATRSFAAGRGRRSLRFNAQLVGPARIIPLASRNDDRRSCWGRRAEKRDSRARPRPAPAPASPPSLEDCAFRDGARWARRSSTGFVSSGARLFFVGGSVESHRLGEEPRAPPTTPRIRGPARNTTCFPPARLPPAPGGGR